MNWFLAKLVFRIFCGNGNHPAQFEEQLRLISADDELHAFYKARLLGEGECRQGDQRTSAAVEWKFIDVIDLYAISEGSEGAETWSSIKEEANADLYIRSVKKSNRQLLDRSLNQFTDIKPGLIGT